MRSIRSPPPVIIAVFDDEKAKSLTPFGTEQSVESKAFLYLKHSGWISANEAFSSVDVDITLEHFLSLFFLLN